MSSGVTRRRGKRAEPEQPDMFPAAEWNLEAILAACQKVWPELHWQATRELVAQLGAGDAIDVLLDDGSILRTKCIRVERVRRGRLHDLLVRYPGGHSAGARVRPAGRWAWELRDRVSPQTGLLWPQVEWKADELAVGAQVNVIDWETTGLTTNDPLQVGVATLRLGSPPVLAYTSIVRQHTSWGDRGAPVHRVSLQAMVDAGQVEDRVGEELGRRVTGAPLLAWGLHHDWPITVRLLPWDLRPDVPFVGLDPLIWYRELYPDRSHKLADAARELGVAGHEQWHDAAADALATARVANVLLPEVEAHLGRALTLRELVEWTAERALASPKSSESWARCMRASHHLHETLFESRP